MFCAMWPIPIYKILFLAESNHCQFLLRCSDISAINQQACSLVASEVLKFLSISLNLSLSPSLSFCHLSQIIMAFKKNLLVCTQLQCETMEEMLASMEKAKAEGADLVELCIDSMSFSHTSEVEKLIKQRALPAIVSYRQHLLLILLPQQYRSPSILSPPILSHSI